MLGGLNKKHIALFSDLGLKRIIANPSWFLRLYMLDLTPLLTLEDVRCQMGGQLT